MTELLRVAIAESGIPLLLIEKETGVTRASIRRFVAGEQSLRLDKAEVLANYFGLELTRRIPR